MGNNSIRDNLSKADIISDITLCLGADIHREKQYLLVEGEDDIKFLLPFLSPDVYIYESYDGKSGVEFIVGEQFANNTRVVGIRDRDYQNTPFSDKIFYYDYGCMEMMIMRNDEVFNSLCVEYYRGSSVPQELRGQILRELKYFSVIRMYNEKKGWGQILRGVSLNSAWNNEKKKLNKEAILDKLNKINNDFFDEEILQEVEQEYIREWSNDEFYHNTQGHDFSMLYATICNEFRKKGIKHTEIEASGRCVFRNEHFVATELYNRIADYANTHGFNLCSI